MRARWGEVGRWECARARSGRRRPLAPLDRPLAGRRSAPAGARGFAAGDKLDSDSRTAKPQQVANATDEATKDSVSWRASFHCNRLSLAPAGHGPLGQTIAPLVPISSLSSPALADPPRRRGRREPGGERRRRHGQERGQVSWARALSACRPSPETAAAAPGSPPSRPAPPLPYAPSHMRAAPTNRLPSCCHTIAQ